MDEKSMFKGKVFYKGLKETLLYSISEYEYTHFLSQFLT